MKKAYSALFSLLLISGFYAAKAQYSLVAAFPNLTFRAPIELMQVPDTSGKFLVVSQAGLIFTFENTPSVSRRDTLLNISSRVFYSGEAGLIGIAFHPDFVNNKLLFLHYNWRTGTVTQTVISSVVCAYDSRGVLRANPSTETIVLTLNQPYNNHNGGKMEFGNDGFLYISLGDGGSGNDPQNFALNMNSLLGKILRINVDPNQATPYTIPADNPYVNAGPNVRPEIWSYGLRNVWKFSVDRPTGRIWAADVGQNAIEEINIIYRGANYGWRTYEGTRCNIAPCSPSGVTMPIFQYSQAQNDKSITGGVIYRGSSLPPLSGHYLYGDYVSGRLWALDVNDTTNVVNTLLMSSQGAISAFGTDSAGEVYVARYNANNGVILKLVNPSISGVSKRNITQMEVYPNPAHEEALLDYEIKRGGSLKVELFSTKGDRVKEIKALGQEKAGKHQLKLSLNNLPLGKYMVQITQGKEMRSLPLIKQ